MAPPPATPRLRPTFEFASCVEGEKLVALLGAALTRAGCPNEVRGRHMLAALPRERRRFWSPWLSIEATDTDPGTIVHGRFSPKPAIWTGFMLSYIALITAGFFALSFGVARAMMGGSPLWWCLLAAAFLAIALAMFVSSQIGQRLAHEQMRELHELVESEIRAAAGDQG